MIDKMSVLTMYVKPCEYLYPIDKTSKLVSFIGNGSECLFSKQNTIVHTIPIYLVGLRATPPLIGQILSRRPKKISGKAKNIFVIFFP